MRFYSSFHTHLAMFRKGNSLTLQDIEFISTSFHEATQIDILNSLCSEFPTNLPRPPLDILEQMKREVTASNTSDKIFHEPPESLNDKRGLRQPKANSSHSTKSYFHSILLL